MIKFLSSEAFRFMWLPIITTFLTILIKIFYKDKRMDWFSWSDFSVAPNLMVTAILIFLIKMSFLALKIQTATAQVQTLTEELFIKGLVFGGLLIGMMGVTWILRENGWIRESITGSMSLKPAAIVLSDTVGAAYLIIAYNF